MLSIFEVHFGFVLGDEGGTEGTSIQILKERFFPHLKLSFLFLLYPELITAYQIWLRRLNPSGMRYFSGLVVEGWKGKVTFILI